MIVIFTCWLYCAFLHSPAPPLVERRSSRGIQEKYFWVRVLVGFQPQKGSRQRNADYAENTAKKKKKAVCETQAEKG